MQDLTLPKCDADGELAPFAVDWRQSRGRLYDEPRSDFRTPFGRDRDRIIHATAFRRLMNKTQVFVVHDGDLYRTRLTHSLEVAQVARTLARRLRVDEDLTELIALAHDLGHPPFGHAGEDALREKMAPYGGFDHNAQALRIVTLLEERYAGFCGLNLSWESLEGLAKHNGPVAPPYHWALDEFQSQWDLGLGTHASVEAQIAAIADDIAYNHHDVMDGLRAGLITEEAIRAVPIIGRAFDAVDARVARNGDTSGKLRRYEALSVLFGELVNDVYDQARRNLAFDPQSVDEIRHHGAPIIRFSGKIFAELKLLREFLFAHLYRHDQVMAEREIAANMIRRAFDYAMNDTSVLPADWLARIDGNDETARARLVCDYISGMTDRFLSRQWRFAHGLHWRAD